MSGKEIDQYTDEENKKLDKEIHPISAVTGQGIKELTELLWQKVKEIKG